MQHPISRRDLGRAALAAGAVAATSGLARRARAAEPFRLRCSLDTAPSHMRNVSVADYLKKLEAASDGRIKTELFSSGQLFADLDVSKALVQGQVEMACPGHWTLTGFIPDADMFQLPIFYGRPLDVTHRATDGTAGQHVAQEIEAKLRSQVLGPWLDLGYQNWYSTAKPIKTLADVQGMKVRSPGGAGISWRIAFWGGIPNTTAWPNVPLALSQGTFDGFVSTDQSVESAKLWEAGVKYSYADHQFVGEYIPLVSNIFWQTLPPDLQTTMSKLWADNIAGYRANMLKAQIDARAAMQAHGVQFTDPTPAELADARNKMTADQDKLIAAAKLSPEIVRLVEADVGSAA